jgi:hypothetical protein
MMGKIVHERSHPPDPLRRELREPARRGDLGLAVLGAIAFCSTGAALAARWHHSLNVDEPFTALAVTRSFSTLLDVLRHDNTPVTYVAAKLWVTFAGDTEPALRSLTAVSYGAAVFLTGLAGRSLGGLRCGIVAALLVASSGRVGLLHAATLRPYALLTLFSALSAWLLIPAVSEERRAGRARWLALTAVHLLGLFTHPIYLFLALGSAAGVWIVRGDRGRALAMTGVAAVAVYVASWGWMLWATLRLPATAWLATPHSVDLWNAYLGIWGNRNGVLLAGSVLALLTAPGAARRVARNDGLRLVVVTAIAALAAPFLVSLMKPVFHVTRTPMLALPFLALAAAGVLTTLGTRLLVTILGVSFVLGAWQFVAASRRSDPDPTRASLAQVLAQARDGDVLVSSGLSYAPVEYYRRRIGDGPRVSHEAFPAEIAQHPGWIDSRAVAHERVRYEAEAAATASRLAQSGARVFVFTKSGGIGADVGELLTGALTGVLRAEASLQVRGAFFDRVTLYVGRADRSPH